MKQLYIFLAATMCACVAIATSEEPKVASNPYTLGLQLNTVLPAKNLPDFNLGFPSIGPVIGIPIGNVFSLQLEGAYGASGALSALMAETGIRFRMATPFFTAYSQLGAHLLNYTHTSREHSFIGGNISFGFLFSMGPRYQWSLGTKVYLQRDTVFSCGGSFSYLL